MQRTSDVFLIYITFPPRLDSSHAPLLISNVILIKNDIAFSLTHHFFPNAWPSKFNRIKNNFLLSKLKQNKTKQENMFINQIIKNSFLFLKIKNIIFLKEYFLVIFIFKFLNNYFKK